MPRKAKSVLIEREAVLRKRHQLTLPGDVAAALGVQEGDVIVIEVENGVGRLRPVRQSYSGRLKGVYGDAQQYVEAERKSWR